MRSRQQYQPSSGSCVKLEAGCRSTIGMFPSENDRMSQFAKNTDSSCWGKGAAFGMALEEARLIVEKQAV
jgi:hypothetical protein